MWVRLSARKLTDSHAEAARELIRRIALLEMSPAILARALDAFPIPVRTLDALHLASFQYLQRSGQKGQLASYDRRMVAAARVMDISLLDLEEGCPPLPPALLTLPASRSTPPSGV